MYFTQLDIVDFYPSIKEDLLKKAIQFAKIHTTISEQEVNIIWHARKSLLFNTSSIWTKRGKSEFDVTMGSYDGAEVCEFLGLNILDLLSKKF